MDSDIKLLNTLIEQNSRMIEIIKAYQDLVRFLLKDNPNPEITMQLDNIDSLVAKQIGGSDD